MLRRLFGILVITCIAANGASTAKKPVHSTNMLVETTWLATHLSDKNLVILHVGADRTAYSSAHIPGARFLALSDIAVTRNGIPNELPSASELKAVFERLGVGDHSHVVLYGDMFNLFAARAYFTLDYLGHGNSASLLNGGLDKWSREHGSTQSETSPATSAVLTLHMHPEFLIEMAGVRGLVSESRVPIIDARPRGDFAGANTDPGIRRPGHIAGAKNVFWAETLVSRENPVLRSTTEIRALYRATGIQPGAKVIVYCKTGIQASHDYFTLKLAGFRPVLYDGSYVEWSNSFGMPVETGTRNQ